MKNIKLTFLGVTILLLALTLNFRHAMNDYGFLTNKLHLQVLAQTSTTSDGSSTSSTSTTSIKTGAVENTGTCFESMSVKTTFTKTEVDQAKKTLGLNASSSEIARWLIKISGSGTYEVNETNTSAGSMEVSYNKSNSYSYKWIQCLGINENPCTPISPGCN